MNRPLQEDGRLHGVLVACQRGDGRWLMIRRSEHVVAPGKVAFPGGAIEVGEGRVAAAMREFEEEMGAAVHIEAELWRMDAADTNLTLWGYLGKLNGQPLRPNPLEVAQVLWLTLAEARAHPDTLPRNDEFLDALEAHEQQRIRRT